MIRLEQMEEEGYESGEVNNTKKLFWRIFAAIVIIIALVMLVTTVVKAKSEKTTIDFTRVPTPSPTSAAPTVRLVDGNVASEGRVELYHNGSWGTICGDNWDARDAHVVCQSLGYVGARDAPLHAYFGEGKLPILLDDVNCEGDENSIFDCRHPPYYTHDCLHSQDASAICLNSNVDDTCDSSCKAFPIHFTTTAATVLLLCDVRGHFISSPSVNKDVRVSSGVGSTIVVPIDLSNSSSSDVIFELFLNRRPAASVLRSWSDFCSLRVPEGTISGKYVANRVGEVSEIGRIVTYSSGWEFSSVEEFPSFVGEFIIFPKQIAATPSPPPPCPASEELISGAYISGYALHDSNIYDVDTAVAKCRDYNWACGGVTCTTVSSCTLRSDSSPKASSSSEYTCLKQEQKLISNQSKCIAWRATNDCSGSGDLIKEAITQNCSYDIGQSDSGICQCGGRRVLPISCNDKQTVNPFNCSYACSLPPVDECVDNNPCEGFPCADPSSAQLNDVFCSCTDGLLGVSINSPPECRSPFVAVAGDSFGCPKQLFPIDSLNSCRNAFLATNSDVENVKVTLSDYNGCVVVDDEVYWGYPTIPQNLNSTAINISNIDTYTLCDTRELPGGLIPPPEDNKQSEEIQQFAVGEVLQQLSEDLRRHVEVKIKFDSRWDGCSLSSNTNQSSQSKPVVVSGNSGIAVLKCVYKYLMANNMSTSWGRFGSKNNLNRQNDWKIQKISLSSKVPYRYALNEVTFSYTSAWWDWDQWSDHINWLALRGVNLPLAPVGQEYLWAEVYREIGLTEEEIMDHFGSPAYQAWVRMGNLEGFGGGVSEAFLLKRHLLQKRILKKMTSLGMHPVLPAFAGHVPRGLVRAYPNSSFVEGGEWNGFPGAVFLQPTDELFAEIAEKFINIQIKSYNGTDHWYSADSFNEMIPSQTSTEYLQQSSTAVLRGIKNADPNGKWILQGWFFTRQWWVQRDYLVKAYLSSVSPSDVLILDLNSVIDPVYARTNQYYGHSYVWCLLHNYGGRNLIYGNLDEVFESAKTAMSNVMGGLSGIGITMEGLNQNDIIYDMTLELAWLDNDIPDRGDFISKWTRSWITSRYSSSLPIQSWEILLKTMYRTSMEPPLNKWVIYGRPSLTERCSCIYCKPEHSIHSAWSLFLNDKNALGGSQVWRSDLAVLTGLVLQSSACRVIDELVTEVGDFHSGELLVETAITNITTTMKDLEQILITLDEVLSTDVNTQLSCWLSDAAKSGVSQDEKNSFVESAARLVTSWGLTSALNDYAKRHWGGLVRSYYLPRWQILRSQIRQILINGTDPDSSLIQFEQSWPESLYADNFTTVVGGCLPVGDIVQIAEEVRLKYYPELVGVK